MILSEELGRLPPERRLLALQDGAVTVDALLRRAKALEGRLEGARVALSFADPARFLEALVALDGRAEAVALISSAVAPQTAARLAERAACEALLTDRPEDFAREGIASPPVVDSLDGFARGRAAGASGGTRWLLTTSGTTGEPKLVSHSLEGLARTTKRDPQRGAGQCWGLLYDHTRFAGLQVLLQSVLSGAKLAVPPLDAPLGERLAFLAREGCTHLSATPTLWRKIVMTPGAEALPLQQITMGGEIADDRILAVAGGLFPQARTAHIFASTEAGVGFSVADRRAGFPESYLTDPPGGVGLKILDGRLQIRNETVEGAYLGGQAFAQDGWVDTGDAVEIRDGRVLFLGRASGVINVGGDKAHPEEIEQALLDHPWVVAVLVYAKSNPITGSLVAADVVLDDPQREGAKEALRRHAAERLEAYKVPAFIRIRPALELNVAGKIVRR